jgi:hypothetical protein|tara:strand:- start:3739 stop:4215 length:477 start_codon:yes stop_codon:yes gene_type:complete
MNKIVTSSLLVVSLVFFNSCKEDNASEKVKKENIITAKKRDVEISKGSAEIEFDITEFDFGTVNEGEIVEAKFTVTNSGKTDLVISNVQASCGCTVPVWPRTPIKPGDSAEVLANFNTAGKPNRQAKTLTLFTNTARGREVLRLKGSVTPKNSLTTNK